MPKRVGSGRPDPFAALNLIRVLFRVFLAWPLFSRLLNPALRRLSTRAATTYPSTSAPRNGLLSFSPLAEAIAAFPPAPPPPPPPPPPVTASSPSPCSPRPSSSTSRPPPYPSIRASLASSTLSAPAPPSTPRPPLLQGLPPPLPGLPPTARRSFVPIASGRQLLLPPTSSAPASASLPSLSSLSTQVAWFPCFGCPFSSAARPLKPLRPRRCFAVLVRPQPHLPRRLGLQPHLPLLLLPRRTRPGLPLPGRTFGCLPKAPGPSPRLRFISFLSLSKLRWKALSTRRAAIGPVYSRSGRPGPGSESTLTRFMSRLSESS